MNVAAAAAVHPAEAAALAGAFAADYLSWDESDPQRRGRVLAQYLPADARSDPTRLGWSGRGRQRAEFALPGLVVPDGDGRVTVDVRVRVTPFRAVGPPAARTTPDAAEVSWVPAAAPAPSARGWKSLDSYWVRLSVPVTRDRGRLVIDACDEQLGDQPASRPPNGAPPVAAVPEVNPTLADDDAIDDLAEIDGSHPPLEATG